MNNIKMNVNVGGGLTNNFEIRDNKVYRTVEDGTMIYNYTNEELDIVIDMIMEQEYEDNFVCFLPNEN